MKNFIKLKAMIRFIERKQRGLVMPTGEQRKERHCLWALNPQTGRVESHWHHGQVPRVDYGQLRQQRRAQISPRHRWHHRQHGPAIQEEFRWAA